MTTIIKPTVGRKVWYRPSDSDKLGPMPMCANDQPLDATIIAVWGDRMVNVLVTDMLGKQFPVLSATLVQDGDTKPTDIHGKVLGRYVEWMPYQTGQAKAVAIETKTYPDGTQATGTAPLPAASPATDDFPLGKACDLTGEGTCEACQ